MNQTLTQKYGTKAEISALFGVNIKTLGTDMTQMRCHPEFCDAILRVSHKRVYISISGYEAYLQYRSQKHQEERLRG